MWVATGGFLRKLVGIGDKGKTLEWTFCLKHSGFMDDLYSGASAFRFMSLFTSINISK